MLTCQVLALFGDKEVPLAIALTAEAVREVLWAGKGITIESILQNQCSMIYDNLVAQRVQTELQLNQQFNHLNFHSSASISPMALLSILLIEW